ncbi:CATRA conflict system CASPASE/TPR repeat-associated protein [Streptomyces griseoaurantiacus]|uniref:CATRA conflict system CASPASE/TPR repeat-associated protein n=1 Tax=Streptomyces griseoaurantiacus TaxID=68213 RepID=UPI0030E59492
MRDRSARQPALVIHVFLRSEPPGAGSASPPPAEQYLRALLATCSAIGITETIPPFPALMGITGLPSAPTAEPARISAAAASTPGSYGDQAVLWTRRGIIGLSVVLSARAGADRSWGAQWARWSAWAPAAPAPEGVLETVVVARGLGSLVRRPDSVVEARVRGMSGNCGALSGPPGPWSRISGDRLLWQIHTPTADHRRRTLVVLAATDEPTVDAWLWHTGGPEPARLTLHLVQAALVRRQLRLLDREQEAYEELDRTASEAADQLGDLHAQALADPAPLTGRMALRAEEDLEKLRVAAHTLAAKRSDLRTTHRAALGLAENMRQAVPPGDDVPGSVLYTDRQEADWLAARADDAAEYLSVTLERVDTVLALGGRFVEERARAQRQHAVTAQTALVGGLLALLAGVQSLTYEVPLPGPFDAPVICALSLLVVVLPTGGLRLVRSDRQDTTPVLFDLLGLGALGCALGWLVATALWWTWQEQAAPPSWSSGAAALGAVLSSLLGRWRMR